ncbi:MAG TPA: zinc ribbon domain-containing protein [Kouleothrix sp.]|uniref:FmdB family zinc ribbon protein n=1 Tax=Kouleothrix sp. TaxID=2779161 RepID=UPI002CEE2508|nr:zinc ribbon domain-containing protein [Kouleothrix sp.]HRC74524.1 zinc ribbon domain-containing protein [Kouleothrix sp.]
MPTYVYACDSCGSQFEQFQSFKDDPLRTCPSCAGAVRRVFQPVGIVFKGSGWYITDSRKSSSATVGAEEAAAKPESKSESSSGDTAAKPAPASTTKSSSETTTAKA